ncbi:hypothetical protein L195_g040055 [Trifolium pratense]|uniref:Uncharacterized protein n=1 Tax=Trifolium pratense TaxID=57577 RepID=A0A2K3LZP0_TRIPR|nr:hypothetical protein L195_g040055 [Trifolium pratense]
MMKMMNTIKMVMKIMNTRKYNFPDSEFKASTSKDLPCEQKHCEDDTSAAAQDESESFSDIDDEEVEGYLCIEQEKHYRRLMWEHEYQDSHEEMMQRLDQT